MCGIDGVYMSSESGVMNEDATSKTSSPPARSRGCGFKSHDFKALFILIAPLAERTDVLPRQYMRARL